MLFSFRSLLKDALMSEAHSVIWFVMRQNMEAMYNRGICNFQNSEIISLSLTSSQMKSNDVICDMKKCHSAEQTDFHFSMFFETLPLIHILISKLFF